MAREMEKLGPFEMIFDGNSHYGIPALAWKIKEGTKVSDSLNDIADKLCRRGWQVPAYSMPANREDLVVQRILVRDGVRIDLASLLIEDVKRTLEYFEKHPVSIPLSDADGAGFNHNEHSFPEQFKEPRAV